MWGGVWEVPLCYGRGLSAMRLMVWLRATLLSLRTSQTWLASLGTQRRTDHPDLVLSC